MKLTYIIALSLFGLSACNDTPTQKAESFEVPDYATADLDLSTPQATAYSMMMAMYRGDADMVDKVFQDGGDLNRVKPDGTVEFGGRARWSEWVGTLNKGQAHEEIFGLEVQKFDKLATVWAPFVISYDGKIVGCGVNQLSMAQTGDEWRIVSGMDIPAPKDDCPEFKSSYLAGEY